MKEKITPEALISPIEELIKTHALQFDSLNRFTTKMAVHIPGVAEWTLFLVENHSEANKEVALLGAWLHDCGHIWHDFTPDEDHAVRGEAKARQILENLSADQETIVSVTRIVRRHRNRDLPPETIEERIVAAADSATHFSDNEHMNIVKDKKFGSSDQERIQTALGKLERDWRDIQVFPELAQKLKEQCEAIKKELLAFSSPPC